MSELTDDRLRQIIAISDNLISAEAGDIGLGPNTVKAICTELLARRAAASTSTEAVGVLTGAEYEAIMRAAIDAYEAATPADYRYSATALRKAVDAARKEEARIRSCLTPPTPKVTTDEAEERE